MNLQMKTSKNQLVFLILDDKGFAWAVAPTKVQARKWISWLLPKGISYTIEPYLITRYQNA